MAATEGQKSVDGDGNQRREVASDERTIRRPEAAEQDTRGRRFWRNFQNLTRRYIYPDPVGVTEWNNSVAPRCRIASDYYNSV